MFKYSSRDILLVIIPLIQIILLGLPFFFDINVSLLIALTLINIILVGTNYQCVAHNFIHLPYFKSDLLNDTFSIINSIGIGVPQSIYRLHHLNHHRFNNRPGEDDSSTRQYGKNGMDENIFSYSFLGLLRTDVVGLFQRAVKVSPLVYFELLFLISFLGLLSLINYKIFLTYVLATLIFGQAFALWENYCEHHYADPNDRKRDSVSCYNGIYNLVWFNNGYHQEHHFSPQVHWTEIHKVRELLPQDRKIVAVCHLTNSF